MPRTLTPPPALPADDDLLRLQRFVRIPHPLIRNAGRNGPPSFRTVLRAVLSGELKAKRLKNRWCTSIRWWAEYIDAQTADALPSTAKITTPARRAKAIASAESRLSKAGI